MYLPEEVLLSFKDKQFSNISNNTLDHNMALTVRLGSKHDVVHNTTPSDPSHKRILINGGASPLNMALPIQICTKHEISYETIGPTLSNGDIGITGGHNPTSMTSPIQINSKHEIVLEGKVSDRRERCTIVTCEVPPSPTGNNPETSLEPSTSDPKEERTIATNKVLPSSIGSEHETPREPSVSDLKEKSTSVTSQVLPSPTDSKHETFPEPCASSLKGKTVLITGGASGLGAAIAKEFAENGGVRAWVTIADINEVLGETYTAELKSQGLNINFIHTDVTSWPSHLTAFKAAIAFGPTASTIDIVIASAGLWGPPFLLPTDEAASLSKDPSAPPMRPIHVNLIGLASTAKLAQHYFSLFHPTPGPQASKALILIGSSGSYLEIPSRQPTTPPNGARSGCKSQPHRAVADGYADESSAFCGFSGGGDAGGKPAVVVKAVLRCAVDESVVGPGETMDLGDDNEGGGGVRGMKRFVGGEVPGYEGKTEGVMRLFRF